MLWGSPTCHLERLCGQQWLPLPSQPRHHFQEWRSHLGHLSLSRYHRKKNRGILLLARNTARSLRGPSQPPLGFEPPQLRPQLHQKRQAVPTVPALISDTQNYQPKKMIARFEGGFAMQQGINRIAMKRQSGVKIQSERNPGNREMCEGWTIRKISFLISLTSLNYLRQRLPGEKYR